MFDPIIQRLQDISPELKPLVTAVIILVGLILLIGPAIKCIKAFSKSQWGEGIMWLLAGIAVIAVSVGAVAVIHSVGSDVGDGMKSNLSFIYSTTSLVINS